MANPLDSDEALAEWFRGPGAKVLYDCVWRQVKSHNQALKEFEINYDDLGDDLKNMYGLGVSEVVIAFIEMMIVSGYKFTKPGDE